MQPYPTDARARRDILEAGRRLYQKGFVAANDGNLSARVSGGCIWATPTGVSKGFMSEDMLIKLDLDGSVLEGALMPSSEIKMHLGIYRRSPDVLGVVHAHPPVSSAFAAAGLPLDRAYLQESVVLLGVIPVMPYALPGSRELAEGVASYVPGHSGLLLEHHGAVAWSGGVMEALYVLERIEHSAAVALNMKMLGSDRAMTRAQIDGLLELRPAWGVTAGGRPTGRDDISPAKKQETGGTQ